MPETVAAVAARLVAQFRRQRPLRGGSLLITLFGDAIAPRGGAITLASLIELASPFGLNERLVRTAMTRLADDGWLESRREGRRSEYRLSPDGAERFAAATRQIYGVPERRWAGVWSLVLLPTSDGRVREAAREVLGWAGFGEPAAGVFMHPALPVAEVKALLHGSPALASALVLSGTGDAQQVHVRLASLGWDLGDIAARYARFLRQFGPAAAALASPPAAPAAPAAAAFALRTLLIHEYRKVHLRDPLLPAELLPVGWVGADAYALCRDVYERVAAASERHLSALGRRFAGELPGASAVLRARFGGLAAA
jgi:phenylacetic acid degradation operon negative regulatory protein